MEQKELDEISDAFVDAWEEFFGQEMFYVPFDENASKPHPIYGENKNKVYDYENKKRFMGTFKELSDEEAGELFGQETKAEAEITYVTKELYEQGITRPKKSALVQITFRDGVTKLYNITEITGKVQLGDNRIFTKFGVFEYA